MVKCECFTCGHKNETATWFDAVKYKDNCFIISTELPYISDEEEFDLYPLYEKIYEKISEIDKEFNPDIDEFYVMSDDYKNNINIEDCKKINFYEEDWGARCYCCGGVL